jgi:uncharacterized protein (TIGR02246 family)
MESEKNMEQKKSVEEIARGNMTLWLATLKTKNPKEVAALYSEDATFLPTVSGEFKHGEDEAEGYFVHFLAKNPEGEVKDETVQSLGDNAYIHSGMYNFELDGSERREIVEARFTYVWKKEADGKWKIIHHHSSVRPKGH